jgi:hypothetical protein
MPIPYRLFMQRFPSCLSPRPKNKTPAMETRDMTDLTNRSQDQRKSMAEQIMEKLRLHGEEAELSFLVGAPAPRQTPETD